MADDDPDARFIYSEYLRAMGCTVFTAADGRAAISKARSLAPDAIVMDLAKPCDPDVLWLQIRSVLRLAGTEPQES